MKIVFVTLAILGAFLAVPEVLGVRNGFEVPKHSIPFQVRIKAYTTRTKATSVTFGGILISQNYVLTAATNLKSYNTVKITLGAHNWRELEGDEVTVTSTTFIIHENYNSSTVPPTNNIAIIELPSPVELSSSIAVANLVSRSTESLEGLTGFVSGWGSNSAVAPASGSRLLRFGPGTIVSSSVCKSAFEDFNESDICFDGKINDVNLCKGDQGGPLIIDGEVVGVASYFTNVCSLTKPSVLTSIANHYSWIVQNSDI